MIVKALDDVCSFSEVGCYLLDLFLLCLEEKVLLVCYVLGINLGGNRSDLKIFLLA
jgi:hypothetical protein